MNASFAVGRIGRTRVYLWQSHCRADTGEDAERARRCAAGQRVAFMDAWRGGEVHCMGGSVCLRIGRRKCLLPEGVRRGRCAAGQRVAFMGAWRGGEVQRLFATWGRSL